MSTIFPMSAGNTGPLAGVDQCYRRESVALNRNTNERLRIRMHRKEPQQPQRIAYLLRSCPQALKSCLRTTAEHLGK
jgi:hypothetical protein